MRTSHAASAVLFVAGLVACNKQNNHDYAEAALLTGVHVAAVGVNRAATHECWARCSPGYLCNQESGLCEPGECLPACEVGTHCTRDARGGPYCARDSDGSSTQSTLNTTPVPVATATIDAGSADAASEDASTD